MPLMVARLVIRMTVATISAALFRFVVRAVVAALRGSLGVVLTTAKRGRGMSVIRIRTATKALRGYEMYVQRSRTVGSLLEFMLFCCASFGSVMAHLTAFERDAPKAARPSI